MTSLIIINLFWSNIYSVIPWKEYKPFNGKNRFGNYLGLIFLLATIEFLLCCLFGLTFKRNTPNERYLGIW